MFDVQRAAKTDLILGVGFRTGQDFIDRAEQNGFTVTPSARGVLESLEFTVEPRAKKVTLVTPSLEELSESSVLYACWKAGSLGLELAPAEVGPQYARDFGSTLAEGESLIIGMKEFKNEDGRSVSFIISRSEGKVTLTAENTTSVDWKPTQRIAFLVPENWRDRSFDED
jgi:hypothetical protein